MRSGVAALIIGNEVLSAKVTELNGAHLIQRLRDRGIPLRSVSFVPDEIDAIVEAIELARRRARWVITSGGIGPTHDDVTVRAVALAMGREVVRLAEMEERIRERAKGEPPPEVFRLADAPKGARLLAIEGGYFPVLACDDVYMLPGIPQLFKLQLARVLDELPGHPVVLRMMYLSCGEPEAAAALDAIALAHPEVAIGSYPLFGRDLPYRVKVTVEHLEAARVEQVLAELRVRLPAGSIIREE